MTEKMKLSEAIQLGAMLRRQAFATFSGSAKTCAMGAALEAVGKLAKTDKTNQKRILEIWPWLAWKFGCVSDFGITRAIECPACGKQKSFKNTFELIIHLNDKDKVSRQRIAEWVLNIEGQARDHINSGSPLFQGRELRQLEANLKSCRSKKEPRKRLSAVISGK